MLTTDQERQLKDVAAEALGVDAAEITDDTSPQTLAAWTSFSHLTLLSSVEEAFGVMFSMEEMTGVHDYRELSQALAQHL